MNNLRSRKLSMLNFICTFMMVYYHAGGAFEKYYYGNVATVYNRVMNESGRFAMSFFSFTSAFLLYKGLNWEKLKSKAIKRLFSLVMPFVLWNIIGMIYTILYSLADSIYHDSNRMITVTLGWLIRGFTIHPFCGGFWFIAVLMVYLLFSPLIILSKGKLFPIVLCISFFANCFIVTHYDLPYFTYKLILYLPNYCFGGAIGYSFGDRILDGNASCGKITCYFFKALLVVCLAFMAIGCGFFLSEVIILLFPCVLWLAFGDYVSDLACRLNNFSFWIYACHGMVLPLFTFVSNRLFIDNDIFLIGERWGVTIVTVVFIILLLKAMKKILPISLFKALSGGRCS